MAEDRLTTLYNWSEEMTKAGEEVKEKHADDYKKIIEYVKTSEQDKERILAAQLVARFFKFFPEIEHEAFDSIVDLCESPNVDVRKHATIAMISICRGSKQVVSKAADILIQLYQTNQPSEVNLINQSLTTLLSLNIEQFLKSFFANFDDGSELVRERALKFLTSKLHEVPESSMTKEIEEQLMEYTKKAMEDVTKEEFIAFIGILSRLKISKTNSGRATLVSAIKNQAELDKDFDFNCKETLDKFLLCTKHTIPLLSQYNRASEYINYICLKILPHLKALAASGHDLNVLQALAEMSPNTIIDDVPELLDIDSCYNNVYNKLLEYLPSPPESADIAPSSGATEKSIADNGDPKPETGGEVQVGQKEESEVEANKEAGEELAAPTMASDKPEETTTTTTTTTTPETTATATTNTDSTNTINNNNGTTPASKSVTAPEADFQFTHIEYLLYTMVHLCRLKPELYTEAMQIENRKKLSHLSNGCKRYTDALERQLTGAKWQDLKKEENKLRSIALRTTKNISTMILGLFKKPADFKTSITLSCKPIVVAEPEKVYQPRPQAHQQTNKGNNQQQRRNNNNNKRAHQQERNRIDNRDKRRRHDYRK